MENNGWTQSCRLHVCVAGDGRHEEVAIKRFGRMPKVFMQRTEDHVIITCEVSHEKVKLLWHQLNEDISRNTLGEVSSIKTLSQLRLLIYFIFYYFFHHTAIYTLTRYA